MIVLVLQSFLAVLNCVLLYVSIDFMGRHQILYFVPCSLSCLCDNWCTVTKLPVPKREGVHHSSTPSLNTLQEVQ